MTTTTISAGQTSTGLNIGSGDLLNISSGGTAINTTDNGEELVFSGGVASSTTVNSGGFENVSGGTTVGTIVTADGEVVVYAGGTTSNTTLDFFGLQLVSSGGTAIGTLVTSFGQEQVWGTASGTTVNSGGLLQVWSGGTATGTTVDGQEIVWATGTVSGSTVNSGGVENVSGGTTVGTVVNLDGEVVVYTGGTTSNTTLNSFGLELVSAGGTAIGTLVTSVGQEQVWGTASGTTVNSGGLFQVWSGGTASGTTVNGVEIVSSGGTASGTTVNSGGNEYVSSGGTASGTTVSSGGNEYVSAGGIANDTIVESGGTATVSSGGVLSGGTISDGSLNVSGTIIAGNGLIVDGGTAVGVTAIGALPASDTADSVIYVTSGGVTSNSVLESARELVVGATAIGTIVSSGGEDDIQNGGTTINDVISSGGIEALLAGGVASNTMIDAGGAAYVFSGSTASNTTISSGGVLVISSGGSGTGTILQTGGTIDAASVPFVSGATATLDSSTDVLTVTDGGNTLTYQMADSYTGDTFLVSSDTNGNTQITLTPCFCTGTRILTDHGEVPVERLTIGHHVATTAGTFRPIKWIGHRQIDFTRHPAPELAQPILIRTNAIAKGAPHRDLLVSPDHALLLDDVLVPARLLVNGGSIRRQGEYRSVTYYHVELDAHDILLAENLAAESYLDTGNRNMFANGGTAMVLHPDLSNDQDRRVALSCRLFADEPALVEPIWRRIAARSAQLAMPLPADVETSGDPELRVVINGKTIKPVSVHGERYSFVLPPTRSAIHLVSRATKPNALRPWVDDHRRLGVMIARLTLKRGADMEEIPLDHPQLTDGWWAAERDQTTFWRWTDGNAVVPVAMGGAAMLEVTLGETLDYPVDRPVVAASMASTKAA